MIEKKENSKSLIIFMNEFFYNLNKKKQTKIGFQLHRLKQQKQEKVQVS